MLAHGSVDESLIILHQTQRFLPDPSWMQAHNEIMQYRAREPLAASYLLFLLLRPPGPVK